MRKLILVLAALGLLACQEDNDFETGRLGQSNGTKPTGDSVAPTTSEPAPPAPAPKPSEAPPMAMSQAPSAAGTEFEALPRQLGAVLCDKIFECCGPGEAMSLILGSSLTRENCPLLAPFYFGDYFEKRTLSLVEQRVSYFPEKVAACVATLGARSCREFSNALHTNRPPYYYYTPARPFDPAVFSCPELFGADQTPDQLCQNDYECVDGHCVTTLGTDKRCRAFSAEGQACGYSTTETRCAPTLACVLGVCRKPGKLGERCYDSYSDISCQAGLYCNGGVCQTKLADGAACSWSYACASGYCSYSPPNYSGPLVCQPTTRPPSTTPTHACTGPQ